MFAVVHAEPNPERAARVTPAHQESALGGTGVRRIPRRFKRLSGRLGGTTGRTPPWRAHPRVESDPTRFSTLGTR
ncbi:hypothetical protein GCM10010442_16500 [Kitasatospora kifunensis]